MTVREPAAPLKICIFQLPQTTPYPNKTITDETDKCIIWRKYQEYYEVKAILSY
jgi:hypothetical protein